MNTPPKGSDQQVNGNDADIVNILILKDLYLNGTGHIIQKMLTEN